jgi:DNA-binding NtrC family response regulator
VITDLRMAGLRGEELLKRIEAESGGAVPVIVLTGHGTVENAVNAMRNGAYDFLTKPLDLDRLSLLVKRALNERVLVIKHRQLREELDQSKGRPIIGNSPALRKVIDTVKRVAPTKASVLIQGESGVGKELVAQAIHHLSPRKDKQMIEVNCTAFPETLLESELFGHEKGAFTGASARRVGRFEQANGSTLFLDEIGEISQNIQVKLLRVIQERKFERIGGNETLDVDIRLVAATNRNLLAEIEKGTFREDLYYRLNVVTITVPPLRERKEDLPLLITSFLKKFAAENDKMVDGIDEKVRSRLYNYDWPGNIRELQNCIESAVVMSKGRVITVEDLPPALQEASEDTWIRIPLGTSLAEAEKMVITATLSANKGNKSRTAEALGIGRKTLHRKLEEWGDPEPHE